MASNPYINKTWIAPPPGWDLKVSYQRNLLFGMSFVLLFIGILFVCWQIFHSDPSSASPTHSNLQPPQYGDNGSGDQLRLKKNTSNHYTSLPANAPKGFLGFIKIIIIPDEPMKELPATPTITPTPDSTQCVFGTSDEGTQNLIGKLGMLSNKPQRIIIPQHSLLKIHPTWELPGIKNDTFRIGPDDIIRQPLIDVRYIIPPDPPEPNLMQPPDQRSESALVVVQIVLDGNDQLAYLRLVSEFPKNRGYAECTLDGLRYGHHETLQVNGKKYASSIELYVYFCESCANKRHINQLVRIIYPALE